MLYREILYQTNLSCDGAVIVVAAVIVSNSCKVSICCAHADNIVGINNAIRHYFYPSNFVNNLMRFEILGCYRWLTWAIIGKRLPLSVLLVFPVEGKWLVNG